MSDVDKSLPFVEVQGKKFGKVSVYLRAELLREHAKTARQRIIDNLAAAGVTGREAYELLQEHSAEPSEDDWTRYINTPLGKAEIMLRGAEAQSPGNGKAVLESIALSPSELLDAVADLCCLPRPGEQSADAGYTDPNAGTAAATPPAT